MTCLKNDDEKWWARVKRLKKKTVTCDVSVKNEHGTMTRPKFSDLCPALLSGGVEVDGCPSRRVKIVPSTLHLCPSGFWIKILWAVLRSCHFFLDGSGRPRSWCRLWLPLRGSETDRNPSPPFMGRPLGRRVGGDNNISTRTQRVFLW